MALTLENINLVKQRCRPDLRKPGVGEALRALFHHMEQLGNPDLQYVSLDFTANADIVVANVACKLYGLCLKKPAASTTNAWVKGSDHATAAAANGDVVVKMVGTGGGGQEHFVPFLDGLKLGTGLTMASHTAVDGDTDSADADACIGFAIIGAA
jgi:hypothetical protein